MIDILGEYQATLDSKGRFLLPAAFKKQLSEEEGTLLLFPAEEQVCDRLQLTSRLVDQLIVVLLFSTFSSCQLINNLTCQSVPSP